MLYLYFIKFTIPALHPSVANLYKTVPVYPIHRSFQLEILKSWVGTSDPLVYLYGREVNRLQLHLPRLSTIGDVIVDFHGFSNISEANIQIPLIFITTGGRGLVQFWFPRWGWE